MPGPRTPRVRQVSASLSGEWQRIEIIRAGRRAIIPTSAPSSG